MQHGVVCRVPDCEFGYFGWPSVIRLGDGTLVAGVSGLRHRHVCPWGKSVLAFSKDEGKTWSAPVVAHDSAMDDRDVGLTALGGQSFLMTWFTLDPRHFLERYRAEMTGDVRKWMEARVSAVTDAVADACRGSWTRVSHDGGETFSEPRPAPVNSPHGPMVLADGRLMYVGKRFPMGAQRPVDDEVAVAVSSDQGATWTEISVVPRPAGFDCSKVHETHACELADGTILCAIRVHEPETLATWMTRSTDGGLTWCEPYRLPCDGSPPHLLVHSSGVVVCAYGYRHAPYGQRCLLTRDGLRWSEEIVLRDDGLNGDLGYPASVELEDGSILTVYYQRLEGDTQTSVLCTRWELPEFE